MAWVISWRVTAGLPSQTGERALHHACADDIMGASYSLLVDRSGLLPHLELRRGGGTRRKQQAGGVEPQVGTPQGTTAAWRWINAGRVAQPPWERQPPAWCRQPADAHRYPRPPQSDTGDVDVPPRP